MENMVKILKKKHFQPKILYVLKVYFMNEKYSLDKIWNKWDQVCVMKNNKGSSKQKENKMKWKFGNTLDMFYESE